MAVEIRLSAYDEEAGLCTGAIWISSGAIWAAKQAVAFKATRLQEEQPWQKTWQVTFKRSLDVIAKALADQMINQALRPHVGPQIVLDWKLPILRLAKCQLRTARGKTNGDIKGIFACRPPMLHPTAQNRKEYQASYHWHNGRCVSESGLHPETWPDDEDVDMAINSLLERSRGRLPIVFVPQDI